MLNLLNGSTYVSRSLVETGYYAGATNRSLPSLLTGNATSAFWNSSASALLMAPRTAPYSSSVFLYSATPGNLVSVQSIGAGSPSISSGDGFEEYLFVTPVSTTSWNFPYYAGFAGGINGGEGQLLFPNSITPYIVLQWDPFDGNGSSFNLYLVTPSAGGNVSSANIRGMGPLGSPPGTVPDGGDYLVFDTSYSVRNNTLSAQLADENKSAVDYSLSTNLSQDGFSPTYNGSDRYYFGAGGSAGGFAQSSWGLLYNALSSSPVSNATYLVTFTGSGLPSGANWSVTLAGTTHFSTKASIAFTEANGSYPFTVGSVVGYTASPGSGSVTVNGAVTLPITFSSSGAGGGGGGLPPILGLPGVEGYVVVGVTVAVAVIAGVLIALHSYAAASGGAIVGGAAGRRAYRRWRKGKGPPPPGASPPGTGSGATGPPTGASAPPPATGTSREPYVPAPAPPPGAATPFCPGCGRPYAGSERFCLGCGRPR